MIVENSAGHRAFEIFPRPAKQADPFEGGRVEEAVFLRVLGETIDVVDHAGIPYVVMGGIGSAALGRPRWSHDIDLFVKPGYAEQAVEAFAAAGFATQLTDPQWLYKALKDGVLVDVIFMGAGGIYFDDEMFTRSTVEEFKGQRIRVIAPEDLVVIKAVVHREETGRHWFDALSIIANCNLDWDYLVRRAKHGARRVLSLLIYAQSNDMLVPTGVIRRLFAEIYES